MKKKSLAFSVHLLTASGAALALLALVAATFGDWKVMFLWLGCALFVDGIDGPLARKVDTKLNAANWDGKILDLVIDYLTYVFIPAYALIYANLVPDPWALICALLITLTGVIYFADVGMKSEDNSFSGFPGVWHMPLLVLLVLHPPPGVCVAIIIILAAAQFTSLKFIHPVRTVRWRGVSLTVMGIWSVCAAWAVGADFNPPDLIAQVLLASSLYLLFVGILMQIRPPRTVEDVS